MIGDGELRPEIEQKIAELGLSDCVKLWGERDDVPELLQGMDVFLFPSLFEGLSVVAIEAQAAGLPVYASDGISAEHKITDLLHFLPLSDGEETWADQVLADLKKEPPRRDTSSELESAGYSIKKSAEILEGLYLA